MSARLTTIVLMTGAALAACAPLPPQPPLDAKAWTRCATDRPGARCDVQVVADATGPHSCALGNFRVVPENLELTGRRPVNIQWEAPPGFGFCDGDGVTLKPGYEKAQRDVFETFGSDDKSGARKELMPEAQCRPFRNWRWANTNPGSTHGYEIRFSDRNGRTCTIDPFIRNG